MTETIKWISINDEMPDSGSEVLVCVERNDCEERMVTIAEYDDSHPQEPWLVDGGLMCFGLVLYWAEVPLGPTRDWENVK